VAAEISVLVPVRDRIEHLANLVAGLNRAVTAGPEFELLVGWMGGEDPRPVLKHARGFAAAALPVEGDELPLAAARNALAKDAQAELLVFLDADCIPSRALLAAYARVLREHDALAVGETRYLPRGFVARGARDLELRRAATPHPERAGLFPASGPPRLDSRHDLFWSLNFGLRRATFAARIGGFDEAYRGYGIEDTDFGRRAARAEVPLCWLGDALAFHQHPAPTRLDPAGVETLIGNVRRYRERWAEWPARGWLEELSAAGLVDWDEESGALSPRASASR
jgi:GT2 family glycosyltransferase